MKHHLRFLNVFSLLIVVSACGILNPPEKKTDADKSGQQPSPDDPRQPGGSGGSANCEAKFLLRNRVDGDSNIYPTEVSTFDNPTASGGGVRMRVTFPQRVAQIRSFGRMSFIGRDGLKYNVNCAVETRRTLLCSSQYLQKNNANTFREATISELSLEAAIDGGWDTLSYYVVKGYMDCHSTYYLGPHAVYLNYESPHAVFPAIRFSRNAWDAD
jgi:hypothetical protein